jgi:pilus assembly protein Flp/PilA
MRAFFKKLSADQNGATAVEYGLIAGIIAVGLVAALGPLSGAIQGALATVAGSM